MSDAQLREKARAAHQGDPDAKAWLLKRGPCANMLNEIKILKDQIKEIEIDFKEFQLNCQHIWQEEKPVHTMYYGIVPVYRCCVCLLVVSKSSAHK